LHLSTATWRGRTLVVPAPSSTQGAARSRQTRAVVRVKTDLRDSPTRLAARASLWNRERKMRLFFETMRPNERTSIVDVGAGDTGFSTEPGVARTHNFFEAMYPWPERITAVSDVPLPNFAATFPLTTCVTADGRDLLLQTTRSRSPSRTPWWNTSAGGTISAASCTSCAGLRGGSSSRRPIAGSRSRLTRCFPSFTGFGAEHEMRSFAD
jgi:hypothetical protein